MFNVTSAIGDMAHDGGGRAMTRGQRRWWARPLSMMALGLVMTVIGSVVVMLLFLQPWRTCEDDTAPAGCPGGIEADGRSAGMVVGAVGVGLFVAGAVRLGNGPWNGSTPTRPQEHNADNERKNEDRGWGGR